MHIGSSLPKQPTTRRKKGCRFFTASFWDGVSTKLVETFISVKVWGLVAITSISTWLLLNGYIQGSEWATVITGVYMTIFGVREIYKVARVNNGEALNGQDTS